MGTHTALEEGRVPAQGVLMHKDLAMPCNACAGELAVLQCLH